MKNFLLKKPFFLCVSSLSAIAVLLRFILVGTNIDFESGFYINSSSFCRILFVIVLLLALIIGGFLYYYLKKGAKFPINLEFDLKEFFSERILISVVTVGFAVNTFYEIFRLANPVKSIIYQSTNQTISILTTLLSAVCLIYFLVLSFVQNSEKLGSSLLSAALVIWALMRALRDYMSFTTIFYVSRNLIDIIYICFFALTALSFCRLVCKSENAKALKLFTFLSPITIVLGFVVSVPEILGYLCGFGSVGESDMFMHFVDLTLSLFLLRFSMHIYSEK